MKVLYDQLEALHHQKGHTISFVEPDTTWTRDDVFDQVQRAIKAFAAHGIYPNQKVGVLLLNQKEFLITFIALRYLGAIVVPLNCQMLPQDIGFVIRNSGMSVLIGSSVLLEKIPQLAQLPCIVVGPAEQGNFTSYEALLNEFRQSPIPEPVLTVPHDVAYLVYTSGTSGNPKGVMLSEKNLLANIEGFTQIVDFGPSDRVVLALPLFHVYGLIIALAALKVGARIGLVPSFQPKSILEMMQKQDVTVLPLVPTMFTTMLKLVQRFDNPQGSKLFPHLRFCVSGGASLPQALLHQIEAILQTTVIEGYGMTEASPVIAVNDPKQGSEPGSVGFPLPNLEVAVFNERGGTCQPHEEGEIRAKGPSIMIGYYELPEVTEQTLTQEGWLKTGDLGYFDNEGRLFISGRIKDLIIKAGENIAPRSIEDVLYTHPAVSEAAVVGQADERLGEKVIACIVFKDTMQATPQEILQHCREHLNPTYLPDQILVYEELPKNATGKILKKILKEWVNDPEKAPVTS